ncbi:Alpha/Beta hydrolase protein [Exophiala viscosa]|uniref:Alpha/Beta hydrolase protein n=1 Tax=Exophiala viscosa TaxID=2486360 RepID=A0AAN6DNM5_9EURO|nr:Alpha/Beta hydrolase protein [Exophiala viscosa]
MSATLRHPFLGLIRGHRLPSSDLVQYSGIPYASISQRFARSTTLLDFPSTSPPEPFDATRAGPECIQPDNATKLDADCNQFPHAGFQEQPQSEHCLYLNITTPVASQDSSQPLPVVVFLHGGAFFLGSSTRPYYTPVNFLAHALRTDRLHVFISVNYRLGALGFLHSPEAGSLISPNNGLHDQVRAFEWIHRNVSGFNGDPERITAIGQSAGAESLSLHAISSNPTALFKQMVALSGSPVTMPCKTPSQHQGNFLSLALKLGIQDIEQKSSAEIAQEFIHAPISKIRDLAFVGAPCSSSETLPYNHPTMSLVDSRPTSSVTWIERAIYSSATFDGGISYNILVKSRNDIAKTFIQTAQESMTTAGATELLGLYGINDSDSDTDALEKICQFESDIGFFSASLAQVQGSSARKKYLQIFDLKNPFDEGGALPKNKFATHTWDIVALLGCYDDLMDKKQVQVIQHWRSRLLDFVYEKDDGIWAEWDEQKGTALKVTAEGLHMQGKREYMGEDGGRRKKLLKIAEREKGSEGRDFLWEGVCRKWLDG